MRTLGLLAGLVVALSAAIAPASAVAVTPRASLTDIENDVMCTACHEPLAVSQSPEADAERSYIEGLIAQGKTKAQIETALVGQYGLAVLGHPPARGINLTVYILPPAILLGGIVFLMVTLPKWRARSRAAAATPLPGATPLSPSESERLDDDLAHLI